MSTWLLLEREVFGKTSIGEVKKAIKEEGGRQRSAGEGEMCLCVGDKGKWIEGFVYVWCRVTESMNDRSSSRILKAWLYPFRTVRASDVCDGFWEEFPEWSSCVVVAEWKTSIRRVSWLFRISLVSLRNMNQNSMWNLLQKTTREEN